MLYLLTYLLTQPAFAEECDAKPLISQLEESTPISSAKAYLALTACDEAAGKEHTAAAFEKILSGSEANEAMVAAIRLGEGEPVNTWLAALRPDERSRAINYLGKTCSSEETVQQFFADAHANLGERFYGDRWHRGLSNCRAKPIQDLLVSAIEDKQLRQDGTRFFNVLEIYARNLGNKAIPTISALAQTTKDEEQLTYLVNTFADAANVGGEAGVNPVASKSAIAAISQLGPILPPQAIEQARQTLMSLNAEEQADELAAYRWKERMEDGVYQYAVTALETAECKNGKTFAYLHYAAFTEPGKMWPEQLQEHIGEKLIFEWELTGAEKCKGTGEHTFVVVKEPFSDDASVKKWISAQQSKFEKTGADYDKSKTIGHDSFSY